jgi:hypothetical protein
VTDAARIAVLFGVCEMAFDTATLDAMIGFGVDYTGDMANPSGNGAIVRVHSDTWGQHVDIQLEDGREINRFYACAIGTPEMRRGCAVRVILTGPVHGAPYLAQLAAAVASRKANDKAREQVARETFEKSEAARVITSAPLFYWNGIKDDKGSKLQKAWFSLGQLTNYPQATITIYARDYCHFSDNVRACFVVQNDTDTMTDYFDSDRIRVIPSHPLYPQVLAAHKAQEAHRARRAAKRA